MEDILVATDGSPDAFFAVEEAVWIAKHVGAEVVSVAVAKPMLTSATDRSDSTQKRSRRPRGDELFPRADHVGPRTRARGRDVRVRNGVLV